MILRIPPKRKEKVRMNLNPQRILLVQQTGKNYFVVGESKLYHVIHTQYHSDQQDVTIIANRFKKQSRRNTSVTSRSTFFEKIQNSNFQNFLQPPHGTLPTSTEADANAQSYPLCRPPSPR